MRSPSSESEAGKSEVVGDATHARGERAARITSLSALARTLRRELLGLGDETAIYQRACRAAVQIGHFRFAWIGLGDFARGTVTAVAEAGEGADYLAAIEIRLGQGPEGDGPTGTAFSERRTDVCRDIASDARMQPWREQALARGFRSSGAFPFLRRGVLVGTLNVYAGEPGFADPLEQYLLEGIAEDIGVALDRLDQEAARADAEARLAESEARHRALFEHASDAIFLIDREHRYVDVNPAGCRLLGYTRAEVLARRIEDTVPAEDLADKPLLFDGPDSGSFVVERRLRRKDGVLVDVEVHAVRVPAGSLHAIVRDVSARNRALAERAATERMASLGRLAQGVGHEINNPLTYLSLSLDHLRELLAAEAEEVRARLGGPLSHAEDGARRIAGLVMSLAAFGRGDAETIDAVPLQRVIGAAIELTANRLRHVAQLEVDVAAVPPVLANEFQLTQVFVNLLLNAADAMEDTRREHHLVRISARVAREGLVAIEVADTGTGIPVRDRERIFDPFFTTKAIGRGTGIGLSISRSIVAKLGGTLHADTAEGGGALFRMTLRTAGDEARPAQVAAGPTAGPVAGRALPEQRLRVLIVDDEPLIGRYMARVFGEHDVTVFSELLPAIELCRRQDFDRIFCDVMFPGGTAEPLYEALLQHKPELLERLVFMTGGAFTVAAQAFLERTGRRFLAKPVSRARLLEALAYGDHDAADSA